MKLILPVAGKSSRYPGMRPKWLLTLPNGQLMIEKSLIGLDLNKIQEVVVIMLKDHERYIKKDILKTNLEKIISDNIPLSIFLLDEPTPSQPATIAKYLQHKEEDFSFFIKDCDNYFNFKPISGNYVAYEKLSSLALVSAGTKSFLISNNFDEIELIAEKKVISDNFCCGGYGFKSSKEFLKTYQEIGGDNNRNLFISHVIQKQLIDGKTFHSARAANYEDYGTLLEFQSYSKKSQSIFCDFDGVLVENSSKFANPPWQYNPIDDNLNYLSNLLNESPYSKVIITTSRPKEEEENIINLLKKFNISCHSIVTDLPHARRTIINDFSASNPFPTCDAINLPRNSNQLSNYFSL